MGMSPMSPISSDAPDFAQYPNAQLDLFEPTASIAYRDDDGDDDDDPCVYSTKYLMALSAQLELPSTVLMVEGYSDIHKLCDTNQGGIYSATKNQKTYRIKQTNRRRLELKEAIPDDDDLCQLVGDDIVKESEILRSFNSKSNATDSARIIKFVDFLDRENDYYLVMEGVGEHTLRDFIGIAHRLMDDDRLDVDNYKEATKRIVAQIAQTLEWLHEEQRVCHLELSPDNILIDGDITDMFVEGDDGESVRVSEEISIRLSDFGQSERFDTASQFRSCSYWLKDSYECSAPRVFDGADFDARKADMFSLGCVLYKMATNTFLFRLPHLSDMGFYALDRNELEAYIRISEFSKFFDVEMRELMMRLLCVDEEKRCSASEALQSAMSRNVNVCEKVRAD